MNHLIVGASAAAVAAAEAIRQADTAGRITLVSDERRGVYSRCLGPYLLAGAIGPQGMLFRPPDWAEDLRVRLLAGNKVEKLLPDEHRVALTGAETIPYDRLLLATGAAPVCPDMPGAELPGVFTVRQWDDVDAILRRLPRAKRAVVAGGGPVGLRVMQALAKRGLKVAAVIASRHVLSQVLDAATAEIARRLLEREGLEFRFGQEVKAVVEKTSGDGVGAVVLSDGREVEGDLFVFAKGVSPRVELAAGSGIQIRRGVVVDDRLQTSARDVYAAGDVAEPPCFFPWDSATYAIWPNAVVQGAVAGRNMAGAGARYEGALGMNALDIAGVPLVAAGLTRESGPDYAVYTNDETRLDDLIAGRAVYRRLVLRRGVVCGYACLGRTREAGMLTALIRRRWEMDSVAATRAVEGGFDYGRLLAEGRRRRAGTGRG